MRKVRSMLAGSLPWKKPGVWVLLLSCLAISTAATFLVDRFSRSSLSESSPESPKYERYSGWQMPELHGPAPDFTLPRVPDGTDVRLQTLLGKRPVVLVFGSLSCDVFHRQLPTLARLQKHYGDRADFLCVYIREAGHEIPGLEFLVHQGLERFKTDPRELYPQAHLRAVHKAVGMMRLPFPVVVDGPEGEVMRAYTAWPLRLVIVGRDGQIALDLGLGIPHDWDYEPLESWLRTHPTPL